MAAVELYAPRTGMERVLSQIDDALRRSPVGRSRRSAPGDAAAMLQAEQEWVLHGAQVADLLVARDIVVAHLDVGRVGEAGAAVRREFRERGVQHVQDGGWRLVAVRLPGGGELKVETPYLRPGRKGLVGRPRGPGKRGDGGAGAYPVLQQCGILDGLTPWTRSEVARQVVLCSGYAEAQEQLARRGLDLDRSTLTRIAVDTGLRALRLREQAFAEARTAPLPEHSWVEGMRIRVSVDGGRARTRHTHRGYRKGKNGRRSFHLQWQEPRLVTIDFLDDEGVMDRTHRPIYEVSLGDADAVFDQVVAVLRLLGAHHAAQVVFVSDGAEWIWARVDRLVEEAGIPEDRVRKVLDYYHATEHVAAALDACRDLTEAQREQLRRDLCRQMLEPDGVARVIASLEERARGRRARDVNKEIRYLRAHQEHMHYAALRIERVPIGSGVVESAIRRVINLRFKSASMCWRPDHLLPLMVLRAIHKSGRWDDFMPALLAGVHWLRTPDTSPAALPSTAPPVRNVA